MLYCPNMSSCLHACPMPAWLSQGRKEGERAACLLSGGASVVCCGKWLHTCAPQLTALAWNPSMKKGLEQGGGGGEGETGKKGVWDRD